MEKILIIGGTRFLGPALIRQLVKTGSEITIFNRGNYYGQSLPVSVLRIKGDRRRPSTMKVLLKKKYDLIYDLCCFNKTDATNLLSNILPPEQIVFLSSVAVYKEPLIYPLKEESELGEWDSFGDYGTQKAKAEKEFINYSIKNNLKLTIFRPVYLLGKDNYFDRESYYFSRIINGDPILIPGTGRALIQFSFLEETALAFKKVPEKQLEQVEILNIAGDEFISISDFVQLCGKIVQKKPKLIELNVKLFGLEEKHFYDDFYPFPNLNFIVSNNKITTSYDIKFKPLRKGLEEVYKDWKKKWNGKTRKYALEMEILKKL